MAAKKLHDIVISELDKIITNPTYREKLIQKNGINKSNHHHQQLQLLMKERQEIDVKQQRILRAYEANTLSLEEFGNAKRRLDEDALRVIGEIEKLEAVISDTSRAKEQKKRFLALLRNFRSNFYKAVFVNQKELLQALIASIVVKGNRIEINYRV